jgi:tetratricopeptide (TPR) repeat protein
MGVLTTFALNARAEANRQRAEAEGLVEFMLTDLRTTLRGVGRLDAMGAVNERALRYYHGQDLARLSAESLERRTRILHAMGEDDETRGDYRSALAKFEEAGRTTQALLSASPEDTDRIFDHAQSLFWIGHVAYAQGRYRDARASFQKYSALADEMLARKPREPKFLREKAYAEGNICSVSFRPPTDYAVALRSCKIALTYMVRVADSVGYQKTALDLANRHAWLADAYYAVHDKVNERVHRHTQEGILQKLLVDDPKNMQLRSKWIAVQLSLARLDEDDGKVASALARLKAAEDISNQMTAFDPSNKSWIRQHEAINTERGELTRKPAGESRNE